MSKIYIFFVISFLLFSKAYGDIANEKAFENFLYPLLKKSDLENKWGEYYFYPSIIKIEDDKYQVFINDGKTSITRFHYTHIMEFTLEDEKANNLKITEYKLVKPIVSKMKMISLGSDVVFSISENKALEKHVRKELEDGEIPRVIGKP